jgi:outer membrane protein TolC
MTRASSATVGILIAAQVAIGQGGSQDASVTLTLEDAIIRGLAASHRVAEAAARHEGAEATAEGRQAASRPQIAAQGGYTRTNHVEPFGVLLPTNQLRLIYPDIPDNYRARLDLQWPVYTAGRFGALERAARTEAAATESDIEAVRADLRFEITQAFWALVTARESARVVGESITGVVALLADVRNQLASGLISPVDVLVVEAQEARQRMLGVQAELARRTAEANLARLAGLTPGTPITPTARLDPPAPPADPGTLVEAARQGRSERQAIVRRMSAAGERHHAALALARPVVAIGGGVDYARPNPRIFPRDERWRHSWDASVNVTWPIFDGGRARAEAREATASIAAVRARLEEFDSLLGVEVRQRVAELEAGRAVIDAAEVAVRAAAEARRVAAERFAAGVATSTDVLDRQVALLQAGLDRTEAIAQARLAEARLNRSLGR